MQRFFNTSGPNEPSEHYTLSLRRRLPDDLRQLIDRKLYFVLHAPRQTGKTTTMLALARDLTREGHYAAALVSMAAGSAFGDDIGAAELAILDFWKNGLAAQLPPPLLPPSWPEAAPGSRLHAALSTWARACPRPLVLFLDDTDALRGQILLSVLRQLQGGYPFRPTSFPWALGLIGLRDVRDYDFFDQENRRIGAATLFNVKERSLALGNFSKNDIADLYAKHTQETGQRFEPGVIERVHELSNGQPWLVNALAREIVEHLVPDPAKAISLALVDLAKDNLIRRRDTHFDSLAARLREERVRKIVEPILKGYVPPDLPQDDFLFALDLGLVRWAETGSLEIANPIYAEALPLFDQRPRAK